MKKLQPFTVRVPPDTLVALDALARMLAKHPLGTALGSTNRQVVARLALKRGIQTLQEEMHGIPNAPLGFDTCDFDEVVESLDCVTESLEQLRDLARPVVRLLSRLESGTEALERLGECQESVELLERLAATDAGIDSLERLAEVHLSTPEGSTSGAVKCR